MTDCIPTNPAAHTLSWRWKSIWYTHENSLKGEKKNPPRCSRVSEGKEVKPFHRPVSTWKVGVSAHSYGCANAFAQLLPLRRSGKSEWVQHGIPAFLFEGNGVGCTADIISS